MKTLIIKRTKISRDTAIRLIDMFCKDYTATDISKEIGLSIVSVNKYLNHLREVLFEILSQAKYLKVKDKHSTKAIVYINRVVCLEFTSVIDTRRDIVIDFKEKSITTPLGSMDKDIERFFEYSKDRLMKFRGISKSKAIVHAADCLARYNHFNDSNLLKNQLMLRSNLIK